MLSKQSYNNNETIRRHLGDSGETPEMRHVHQVMSPVSNY
jgi:hypothetical protein